MSNKSDTFYFQQFAVDQSGCAMKVNTDGVLLGALLEATAPKSILDIGTGTGVIAMMLAQRFPNARIEALDVDEPSAATASKNFAATSFSTRLKAYHSSFQNFSDLHPDKKYDLIISNPPFFTNSFKNPDKQKQIARHADNFLFKELIAFTGKHLEPFGRAYFILPLEAAKEFIEEGLRIGLNLRHLVSIKSSEDKAAHRQIIGLGFEEENVKYRDFVIYRSEKVYSEQYKLALKDFLTIFKD